MLFFLKNDTRIVVVAAVVFLFIGFLVNHFKSKRVHVYFFCVVPNWVRIIKDMLNRVKYENPHTF